MQRRERERAEEVTRSGSGHKREREGEESGGMKNQRGKNGRSVRAQGQSIEVTRGKEKDGGSCKREKRGNNR